MLFESADFLNFVANLATIQFDRDQRKALRKRLQSLVSGPNRRIDEVSDDPRSIKGRNTALELVVASRFMRAGLPPDFRGVADITVKYEERKIFVEAKRCRSEKKIVGRFNEAIRQCNQRIEQSGSSVASGIAVVDFSVIANPQAATTAFATDADAAESLQQLIDTFTNEVVPEISLSNQPRVLALMIRYSGMVRTKTLLSSAEQWSFVKNSNVDLRYASMTDHIARALLESFDVLNIKEVASD